MSSIGAFPGFQPGPPEARVAHSLANKIETGDISGADGAAIASSLEAIHGELKADRQDRFAQGLGKGPKPSKEELSNKLEDLVNKQVEAGTLSEEQGEQLSELFEEVLSQGPKAGLGGPKPDGPKPDGPKGAESWLSQANQDNANAEPPSSSTSPKEKSDALMQFLQQLQQEPATDYGQDGTLTSTQPLLFNYTV